MNQDTKQLIKAHTKRKNAMSKGYDGMPKKSKIINTQHGLKRLIVKDRTTIGCPILMEVWVPTTKWLKDSTEIVMSLKMTCASFHSIDVEALYVEM